MRVAWRKEADIYWFLFFLHRAGLQKTLFHELKLCEKFKVYANSLSTLFFFSQKSEMFC